MHALLRPIALAAIAFLATPALAQKTPPSKSPPAEDPAANAPAVDYVVQRSKEMYPDDCYEFDGAYVEELEVFDLTYRYDYDEASQPDRPLKLYRVFCYAGAYNLVHVYYTWEPDFGLKPLTFAEPHLDIRYADPDNFESAVEEIRIDGMVSTPMLVNSGYDTETSSIVSDSHWRGLADASSSGVWAQDGTEFVLKTYDVDASYDGEVNPERILDYTSP